MFWDIISVVSFMALAFVVFASGFFVPEIDVDPEYINGFLAASSVLFGFWMIIFFRQAEIFPKEPEDYVGKRLYASYQVGLTYSTIFLLLVMMAEIIVIYLGAIGALPLRLTLSFSASVFMINLSFIFRYVLMVRYYWRLQIAQLDSKKGKPEPKENDNLRNIRD